MVKRSKENRRPPRPSAAVEPHPHGPEKAENPAPEGASAAPSARAPASGERLAVRASPLDGAVRELFGLTWGKARDAVRSGKVRVDGSTVTDPFRPVRPGSTITFDVRARRRGAGLDPDAVVFSDAHVIVVRKPAGISTVPFSDEEGTLDELVRTYLGRAARGDERRRGVPPLGVVHRLDKETSGLVVFTRTWLAKQSLAAQFREHTVHRRYLAIAHGSVRKTTFRTHLIENRGDGLRGSFRGPNVPPAARLAITHVEPLKALAGATFVACRLETGRTHQIRIHLSEAGHPIVGEHVYDRDARRRGDPELPAPRLMLHAAELGFIHPKLGREMRFEEPLPEDMKRVLAMLEP